MPGFHALYTHGDGTYVPAKIMKKPNILHYVCAIMIIPIALILMIAAVIQGADLPLGKGGPRE